MEGQARVRLSDAVILGDVPVGLAGQDGRRMTEVTLDIGECLLTPSRGTTVTFTKTAAACLSNTISYGSQTCDVSCEGAGYPGVITATTTDGHHTIQTSFGSSVFRAETGFCSSIFSGDSVVFKDLPAACALTFFADTTSGQFCDLFCF